ncbi:MAG: SEL1-like repeat protein, partial [Caulobacteraceae bacterium]
ERITERLAERIANSDRRSAQAIDEVGDQVARITERLGQRQERATDDLGERIRQSEERTAALLKEARATIDSLAAAPPVAAEPPPAITETQSEAIEEEPIFGDDPFIAFPPAAEAAGDADWPSDDDGEGGEKPGASESFPLFGTQAADGSDEDPHKQAEPTEVASDRTISFEPIDEEEPTERATPTSVFDGFLDPAPAPEATIPAPAAAFAMAPAGRTGVEGGGTPSRSFIDGQSPMFERLSFRPARRRRQGARTAALGFGMAAAFGLALGGFFIAENEPSGALVSRLTNFFGARPSAGAALAKARAATPSSTPREAVALAPSLGAGTGAQGAGEVASLYGAAVAKLEANEPGGAGDLRRAAELGYAPAAFYLAKLYETGADGLRKDPVEARRWTEKAAQAGDARAMHNLALYEVEGTGGGRDIGAAADWFRRAANLGLADSQYNLARLYEQGFGVPPNAAEAYKWYLIAARSGDAQSRAGAARVRTGLSADARSVAERAAAEFRPAATDPAIPAAQANGSGAVITAQEALSALGYYQGPTDGAATPALALALSAYQRDQGLPPTGAPDAVTMGKLAVLVR